VIPSSTRIHVTYFLSLIICKNVFMKKLEGLLHHHMTVNQHQATMVRKQKFEVWVTKVSFHYAAVMTVMHSVVNGKPLTKRAFVSC